MGSNPSAYVVVGEEFGPLLKMINRTKYNENTGEPYVCRESELLIVLSTDNSIELESDDEWEDLPSEMEIFKSDHLDEINVRFIRGIPIAEVCSDYTFKELIFLDKIEKAKDDYQKVYNRIPSIWLWIS